MKSLILSFATLAAAASANAITWQTADYFDLDFYGDYAQDQTAGISLTDVNPSASGMFDIIVGDDPWDRDGFNPSNETVTEAEVVFLFVSDSVQERVSFTLDSLFTSSFQSVFSTVNFGDGSLVLDVQDDGKYEWTVGLSDLGANPKDSVLAGGYLAANVSVPDSGATAGLLGLAVLGLLAVRRKLK